MIFGRALWLALFLTVGNINTVRAHALPGSVLTFSSNDDGIGLAISLPFEDLVIADGSLSRIEGHPFGTPLDNEDLSALARYFKDHLSVQKNQTELAYEVEYATLQQAYDEHIGHYSLMNLSAKLDSITAPETLTFIYDAVMHEVRNHRAIVFWSFRNEAPCMIVEFGYRPTDGIQQAFPIARSASQLCN